MASNPSVRPSLRIVSDSMPPSSARSRAARRIRSLLRGRRGAGRLLAIDKSYAVRLSYTVNFTLYDRETMRAAIRTTYGSPDVVELREIEKPDVADDGVLVRVHAASLNRADWYILTGT